jgi:iron complex outermembrane receptor protein
MHPTSELGDRYYDDFTLKQMEIFFAKANYQVADMFVGDLQCVMYTIESCKRRSSGVYFFFNLKAGFEFEM